MGSYTTLADGTVIPSFIGTRSRGESPGAGDYINDHVLRLGEVKKLIYPDDPLSYGKQTVEYDIEVQYRDGSGILTTSMYRGATTNTLFGGISDHFHATLRPDTNPNADKAVGEGSKVIILCLSGDQKRAIIMGGIEDPAATRIFAGSGSTTKAKKDDGHNLSFEFNGFRVVINKDGELSATFNGATTAKAKLKEGANKDASGSFISFNKDGVITLATKDLKQILQIDPKEADPRIRTSTTGEWLSIADKKAVLRGKKGIEISSLEGGGIIDVKNNIQIHSSGVYVGAATEAWIKGTSYRKAESSMNNSNKSSFQQMATYFQAASIAIKVAATANSVPMSGGAAANPSFQAVSQALDKLASEMSKIASNIGSFEGEDYLSTRNFGD